VRNPSDLVDPPKPARRVLRTWTADQYLTVRRSKTATGRRRVELDPVTIAVLRAHRRRQAEKRLAFGAGYRDHGRVFTQPGGEPLNPDAVSIQFKRRAARLGLPPVRFHDLRHGWATMALEAGEHPKVVAEQLGQASVRDAGHLQPRDAGCPARGGHQGGQPLPGPCCLAPC
jgi:integrase